MTEFVRAFQRRAGLTADGVPGPKTYDALSRATFAPVAAPVASAQSGLTRIIWHWSAGRWTVSDLDREHYHFIITGTGDVVAGDMKPEDNLSAQDGRYAAHTRGANTGSIGVALAAMGDAIERPFSAGQWPIKPVQVDKLVTVTADLCRRYGIKVTPQTVLSHAEVQPTLGIPQRGKIDIIWIPGMATAGDPVAVGNVLRARVIKHMEENHGS